MGTHPERPESSATTPSVPTRPRGHQGPGRHRATTASAVITAARAQDAQTGPGPDRRSRCEARTIESKCPDTQARSPHPSTALRCTSPAGLPRRPAPARPHRHRPVGPETSHRRAPTRHARPAKTVGENREPTQEPDEAPVRAETPSAQAGRLEIMRSSSLRRCEEEELSPRLVTSREFIA